ncbi:hypothetical protein [Egicoccus sp. AB-alg6-2]
MHPAASRNAPPGWRGALRGITLVALAAAALAVAGLGLAAAAAQLA